MMKSASALLKTNLLDSISAKPSQAKAATS